ncbi:MAG: twin-arginine translocase subunit TatC, partial [Acidobacteria bacterium]
LIVSFVALGVAFLVCWNFADRIFGWLDQPLAKFLPPGEKLVFTRLTEPFMLYMKVAFFAGIFVASPVILWQLWLFISPGLYKRERRYAAPFIIIASLFFIIGGYFGWRVLLPGTCAFFLETGKQFKQMIKVDEFFSFASTIILATGLVFETPILIFFLARLGIVTPAFLMQKSKWRVADDRPLLPRCRGCVRVREEGRLAFLRRRRSIVANRRKSSQIEIDRAQIVVRHSANLSPGHERM